MKSSDCFAGMWQFFNSKTRLFVNTVVIMFVYVYIVIMCTAVLQRMYSWGLL